MAGSPGSKQTAASPATSRSTGRSEHATGTPRAIASSTGRPKPSKRVAVSEEVRGGVERLEPLRVDGAEQPHVVGHAALGRARAQRAGVGAVAGEREHGARVRRDARGRRPARARFLCGRSERDAEHERPLALADVGGRAAAAAGGAVTPLGTTAIVPRHPAARCSTSAARGARDR